MITLDEWHERAAGASEPEAARIAQVHRTTAARWREHGRIPYAARALLRIHLEGALPPCAGPGWQGWRFGNRDGLLYAPDLKRGFDARDLYQLHWLMQMDAWRAAGAQMLQRSEERRVGKECRL